MGWDLHYAIDPPAPFGALLDAALARCDALGYEDVDVSLRTVGGGARRLVLLSIGVTRGQVLEVQPMTGELELALVDAEAEDGPLYVTLMFHGEDRLRARELGVTESHTDNGVLAALVGQLAEEIAQAVGAKLETC